MQTRLVRDTIVKDIDSPALLSFELVSSAKDVTESTPWPKIQEALCLQGHCKIKCLLGMFFHI